MRALRGLLLVALVAALSLTGWRWARLHEGHNPFEALRARGRVGNGSRQADLVPTCRVKPMDLEAILLATGSVEPANPHTLMAPMADFEMRVEYAVPDGSLVKPGEVIIRVGIREAEDRLNTTRDSLQRAKESLEQAKTDGARRIENAKSATAMAQQKLDLTRAQNAADLERMQAELDQAKEELTYSEGQLAKMERLFEQGIATRDQRDQEKRTYDERDFAYQTAVRALANGRRDRAEKDRAAVRELAKSTLDLADAESGSRRSVESAEHNIENLLQQVTDQERQIRESTIRADAGGIVLLNVMGDETGQHPLRLGDRIWQGYPLGQIMDPEHLRVACQIDEVDARRVRSGQKVRLRVGTARDRVFPGRLESLNSIAVNPPWWRSSSPGRKSFAAMVEVKGGGKELLPGTTAWLEIVVGEAKGKLAVPHQAVFQSKRGTVVYRRRGERFEEVPVKLGLRNDLYWTVASGLRDGDEVCTEKPAARSETKKDGSEKASGKGREGERG